MEQQDRADLARARQLLQADHDRDAERLARQVLGREPTSVEALQILGRSLIRQGRGSESVEVARAGLALAPDDHDLAVLLTEALILVGRSHEARGVAAALVAGSPLRSSSHYTLSRAYLGNPIPQPQRAMAAAQEARRLAPHDPEVLNLCGVCHRALGEVDRARQAFEEALQTDPTHVPALANLAALDITGFRLVSGGSRLTMAMLTSPQWDELHQFFTHQLTLIAGWFFALALGSLVAVSVLTPFPWWVHALTAVVLTLAMVALALPVLRSLPRRPWTWAPLVWRRSTWPARAIFVIAVLLAMTMLGVGLIPWSHQPPTMSSSSGAHGAEGGGNHDVAYGVLGWLVIIAARVWWVVRSKRRGGPPSPARAPDRGPSKWH